MIENYKYKYCVYTHSIDENIFYVGCGTHERPYIKGRRGKDRNCIWFDIAENCDYNYLINIVFKSDSKKECLLIEEILTKHYKSLGMCQANINIANRHSFVSKNKISIARIGKYKKENNGFYGKHHSDETIEKLRKANIGKKYSNETNLKKANFGENNPSSKEVVAVYDDGNVIYYKLIKDLIDDIKCLNASAYARGVLGTPKHYWRKGKCFIYYKEEYWQINNQKNRVVTTPPLSIGNK